MPYRKNSKLLKVRQRAKSWLNRLLKGTWDYYACFLPSKKGFFISWLLNQFYSGIYIGKEQTDFLKNLPENAIVVYTLKYKSLFEFLFYHVRYRKLRLPVPELFFDHRFYFLQPVSRVFRTCLSFLDYVRKNKRIPDPYKDGFHKRTLLASRCAMISLVEKNQFYKRFVKSKEDPIAHLIRIQKKTTETIYLVPLLMFFDKKPSPSVPGLIDVIFGSIQRPGFIRRAAILIRKPETVFAEISHPVNLKQFITSPSHLDLGIGHQALVLRRRLLLQHNMHRQSITGPVVKSNEEIRQSILTNDRMQTFIKTHAASRKEPIATIRKRADRYLNEIAARYSPMAIKLFSVLVGWIVNSIYDGVVIDQKGLNTVKNLSRKGPLVFIPCHKSHIDYLILSYVLYKNNMAIPHVAAGKNLSFWPLGPIFRAGGAFFLRRTFTGAVLYSTVFAEYVHKLLEEGFHIEQFIEGGRSRTGKLLMPKLGLLSMLLSAYQKGACKDLVIAPVYIGYDRILEESAYIHEIEGGKKEPENLSQVIRARKFLKKRYGKIYINFPQPISTSEICLQTGPPMFKLSRKDLSALCRNLGWRIINAINRKTVATPHAIAAASILNIRNQQFSQDEILENMHTCMRFLITQDASLSDTLIIDQDRAFQNAVDDYQNRKLIEKVKTVEKSGRGPAKYTVNKTKRSFLDYYKNNCISYFINGAFTAAAILEKDAFQFSAAGILDRFIFFRDFMKYEFAHDMDRIPDLIIRNIIKAFVADAMLVPHKSLPDTFNVTSTGFRKLKLFAGFLKPYFESYKVVLQFLKQNEQTELNTREKVKKIQSLGQKMYKDNEIELIESISRVNYTNGLSFFSSKKIEEGADLESIHDYEKQINHFILMINK